MADEFERYHTNLESPIKEMFTVTPNDSTDLTKACRALYIGESGDLKVTSVSDNTVTFKNVVQGSMLPIRVKRVFSTDTTANSIIGLL